MSYNRFLELLLKQKYGTLSSGEERELQRFLENTRQGEKEFDDLVKNLIESPLGIESVDNRYIEQRWTVLQNKMVAGHRGHSPGRIIRLRLWAAASILLLIALGITYFLFPNDIVIEAGKMAKVNKTLPDGTKVWLNSGTTIAYSKNFGKSDRNVELSGEAFFDVAHNKELPFVVHTKRFDIKVLGTVFNVKAYETDNEYQATLLKGKIELTLNNKKGEPGVLLKPDEKFSYRDAPSPSKTETGSIEDSHIKVSHLQRRANDSVAVETAWMNNCLAFTDAELGDIAMSLSRWFGVQVNVKGEQLKQKQFSGLFREEKLDEVLKALQLAGKFNYSISGDKVTIY